MNTLPVELLAEILNLPRFKTLEDLAECFRRRGVNSLWRVLLELRLRKELGEELIPESFRNCFLKIDEQTVPVDRLLRMRADRELTQEGLKRILELPSEGKVYSQGSLSSKLLFISPGSQEPISISGKNWEKMAPILQEKHSDHQEIWPRRESRRLYILLLRLPSWCFSEEFFLQVLFSWSASILFYFQIYLRGRTRVHLSKNSQNFALELLVEKGRFLYLKLEGEEEFLPLQSVRKEEVKTLVLGTPFPLEEGLEMKLKARVSSLEKKLEFPDSPFFSGFYLYWEPGSRGSRLLGSRQPFLYEFREKSLAKV